MRLRASLLTVALATGCAPALREPPSEADLLKRPAADATSSLDAKGLLDEAERHFARRPEIAEVRRAEDLFLRAAAADPEDPIGLIGAVRAKTWLADHEPDASRREELAVSAVQAAQWCLRRAPADPACDYWLAIALGIQAREKRSTAERGLTEMVAALRRAAAADPLLDDAGPHRVLALVLLRAPGWPLGPGDPESGLDEARRAVALRPEHAPNLLALAEAQKANGENEQSLETYRRALEQASAQRDAGVPEAETWIDEAASALGVSRKAAQNE